MNAYDWLPHLRAGTNGHEVAEALNLRRTGTRYVCPSCKAPGLEVLEQTFTCSRCGIHGDLIALVVVAQQTDLHGAVEWLVARAMEDIAERKRAEQALRESEERYRTLVETSPDGILLTDLNGTILIANRRAAHLHGYDNPEEMVGLRVFALVISDERGRAVEDARRTYREGEVRDIGYTMLRKDGSTFPGEISASLLRDSQGQPAGTIGIVRDITVRKRAEEALHHQAMHDALTDLPNRILFGDRLEQAIHAARRTAAPLALLLLDLNNFKDVNDTFGHHYGDLLLQKLALRLRATVRDSDTVARLGGDEFSFLLPATDEAGAGQVAEKVLLQLCAPVHIEEQTFSPEGSIGIAIYPQHGEDGTTLLRHADLAMYSAKRRRLGYLVFSSDQELTASDQELTTVETVASQSEREPRTVP